MRARAQEKSPRELAEFRSPLKVFRKLSNTLSKAAPAAQIRPEFFRSVPTWFRVWPHLASV